MFGFPTAQDSPRGLSGPYCCSLGALQGRLGALLGALWAISGSSSTDLGPSWGPLGLSWSYLGGILEASWAVLGRRKPEQARTSKSFNNFMKINVVCFLGPSWRASWSPLGSLPGLPGASWTFLEGSWPVGRLRKPSWAPLWAVLVPSWSDLAPSWGPLEGLLGDLGVVLGRLGALLGASWAVLGLCWRPLRQSWAVANPNKREPEHFSKL